MYENSLTLCCQKTSRGSAVWTYLSLFVDFLVCVRIDVRYLFQVIMRCSHERVFFFDRMSSSSKMLWFGGGRYVLRLVFSNGWNLLDSCLVVVSWVSPWTRRAQNSKSSDETLIMYTWVSRFHWVRQRRREESQVVCDQRDRISGTCWLIFRDVGVLRVIYDTVVVVDCIEDYAAPKETVFLHLQSA